MISYTNLFSDGTKHKKPGETYVLYLGISYRVFSRFYLFFSDLFRSAKHTPPMNDPFFKSFETSLVFLLKSESSSPYQSDMYMP